MAHISTPETRAHARDKAEIIGDAQRIITEEARDRMVRVAAHRAFPPVAVAVFFGIMGITVRLVESINL